MRRTALIPLVSALLAAGPALSDAVIYKDPERSETFEAKDEIVALATEIYGKTAVFDSGQEIPESVDRKLVAGNPLPADAERMPVPDDLAGRLPHTEEGTRWVKVGEHLLELAQDDVIVTGVYEVLP